jgi:hypothetical protein
MSGLMVGGLLNWRLLYMHTARVWVACETRSAGRNSERGVGERERQNAALYVLSMCMCKPPPPGDRQVGISMHIELFN